MRYSRRDFGLLFPALAAATASAQTTQGQGDTSVEKLPRLETKAYIFDELPVTTNGQNRQRRMSRQNAHRLQTGVASKRDCARRSQPSSASTSA